MKKLSDQTKGLVSIVTSAFCFATIGTLGILLFNGGANPITLLIGRFLVATLMLFITILVWNKKLFRIEKKDIKWFIVSGLLLFAQLITFWYGFNIVKSVAIQYSLFFTYPIWIAILAPLLLKEKLKKAVPVCLVIGIVGVLMVLGIIPNGVSIVPMSGILLGLLTAVFWALYYFSNQVLVKRNNAFTILFYNFIFVFLACIFIQPISLTISQISMNVLWYLLAIGFVSTYLSYLFLQYALKFSGSVVSSIQNMILPFLGVLLAFIVLHQTINIYQIIGGCLIISNIYILNKWKN
jgi:drug/metabolite transporter (DMT)-like permease